MYTSHLDLNEQTRKGAISLLQARLSDALALEAQTKQAHWNVKGRDFIQLHEFFDSVHGEIEEIVDTLAERITALGGVADGRIQTTARASTLHEYALETRSGDQHLKALAAVLAQFGRSIRKHIDMASELGDADTADVFTEISRETDKQLWLVEAHLES